MAYDVPSFLKRDGDALLFNQEGEFIFYVPEQYFSSKNAFMVGEYVNLLGVLDYAIFDKSGKHNGLKPFFFPTVFLTKPSIIEKVKDVNIISTAKKQDYRLLKYKKGDQIVVSVKVPTNIEYVEDLFQLMLITGNIPSTIKYDEIQNYFTESIKLNGSSFGVSLQVIGIIISVLCRSKKDEAKEFRLTGDTNMLNFDTISITNAPKFVSPFAAMISENFDESVMSAMLNSDKKVYSPMEKIMMK